MKSATGTYLALAPNRPFPMFPKTLEQTQTHRTRQERSRKPIAYRHKIASAQAWVARRSAGSTA